MTSSIDFTPLPWMTRAACAEIGPGPWDEQLHPEPGQSQYAARKDSLALTEMAKAVCASCPVRQDCLDYAIALDIRDGVYGGMTSWERTHAPMRPHGTVAAYRRHKRLGEEPCPPCLAAIREDSARRRAA